MRINLIEPEFLSDQHLVAEYNEIKFLSTYIKRSLATKKGIDRSRIKESYTLNAGHAYFFYDKVGYVIKRLDSLIIEMKKRGFTVNYPFFPTEGIPKWCFGNYSPSDEEKKISLERIIQRINLKPKWYKYYRKPMNWNKFYKDLI